MLNTTDHQGNANQNHSEKSPQKWLISVRMATIEESTNEYWLGHGEKGILVHRWECKLVQSLWKTIRRFIKTLKIELP